MPTELSIDLPACPACSQPGGRGELIAQPLWSMARRSSAAYGQRCWTIQAGSPYCTHVPRDLCTDASRAEVAEAWRQQCAALFNRTVAARHYTPETATRFASQLGLGEPK